MSTDAWCSVYSVLATGNVRIMGLYDVAAAMLCYGAMLTVYTYILTLLRAVSCLFSVFSIRVPGWWSAVFSLMYAYPGCLFASLIVLFLLPGPFGLAVIFVISHACSLYS